MSLAGKIVGTKDERVTVVLVEGYSEYVPLNCIADDIEIGDSFYKPPNSAGEYFLFKRDSTGVFKRIELYRTEKVGHCEWRWAKF
ncbi:MAG TPA: hypothetical protein VGG71_10090 [Chitinophagaceae bacterium]